MRHSSAVKTIGALALVLAMAANLALAGNPNPKVLPPNSKPGGKSYGEWGAEWWKWALSFPADQSPITDPDGRYGSLKQSGNVWFLAGNFGGVTERSITIPAGKMIFFPLANYWDDWPCVNSPDFKPAPGQTLEEFLTADVAVYVGMINNLTVEVDQVALKDLFNYRGTSGLTPFVADASQIAFDPCITGGPEWGVADGYWLMLAPLSRGEHTLHFTAQATWGFMLDVTYHVTIK